MSSKTCGKSSHTLTIWKQETAEAGGRGHSQKYKREGAGGQEKELKAEEGQNRNTGVAGA